MDDLSPYLDEEDELPSLRTNSLHAREDDRDQVQYVSMSKEAHGPNKEVAFLVAAHETSQPASSRNWPAFVTLVS